MMSKNLHCLKLTVLICLIIGAAAIATFGFYLNRTGKRFDSRLLVHHISSFIFSSTNSTRGHPVNKFWDKTPNFTFYLRLTYSPRSLHEYKDVLVPSMKLFVPNEIAKLVVVLDGEKSDDHKFGNQIKTQWPFPKICYAMQGDASVYHGWGKARMFWDMMHPDQCTASTYTGYIDTDTMFDTMVTPQLLFEYGKPVIVAKIGLAPYPCWEKTTERFLGRKEVMQCMSTFPVTVKTEHMKEMRDILSKQFGKSFAIIFRASAAGGDPSCICQFSLMCNYLWYYHKDEYSWHFQTVPDGNWNGADIRDGQVDVHYYQTYIKPEMKIPIPRTSVHLRYTLIKGVVLDKREPSSETVGDIIKEGLCYSAGFDYCPEQCKKWNPKQVQHHLYSFETYQWFWDKRCKEEQDKHYRNVKEMVEYYVKYGYEIFGLRSMEGLCKIIEDWKYQN